MIRKCFWKRACVLWLGASLFAGLAAAKCETRAQDITPGQFPQVFLLDAKRLANARQQLRAGDKDLATAWKKLEQDAARALIEPAPSIVSKGVTPPSGDKHDYMSQAPYFWPDPKSPNGLPYIRRDGERNPEINKITDHRSLDELESSVETLALA